MQYTNNSHKGAIHKKTGTKIKLIQNPWAQSWCNMQTMDTKMQFTKRPWAQVLFLVRGLEFAQCWWVGEVDKSTCHQAWQAGFHFQGQRRSCYLCPTCHVSQTVEFGGSTLLILGWRFFSGKAIKLFTWACLTGQHGSERACISQQRPHCC